MTDILVALAARLRREVEDLQRVAVLAQRRWRKALTDEDYLGSVALDLQGFYQGAERALQLIAKTVDGDVPSGDDWHRRMLEGMASEIEGVRPAVISTDTRACLDRLRRFRHVARNVYAFRLAPDKLEPLVRELPRAAGLVGEDLEAFAAFLESRASGGSE